MERLRGAPNLVDNTLGEGQRSRRHCITRQGRHMHTENRITIRGDIDHIFAVASAVEAWPGLLPHYRWVTVLSGDTTERLVEMAAHRDGFPLRLTARQRLEPHQHRIHFTHIRGIIR